MHKVIDLFCGCGGFSEGFQKSGFDVLGIDIWDICLKTHNGNTMCFDISKLQKHDIPSDFQQPLVIIGSPPCQTFSTANIKNRNKDATLIHHFYRIVQLLQPKFYIWENVIGSRCIEKGVIIDAQHFGVAQRRKRNFVANFDLTLNKYHQPPKNIDNVLYNSKKYYGILDGYNSTIYRLDDVAPTIRRICLKWYDNRYNGNIPKPLRFSGFPMLTIEEHLILMGFSSNKKIYGTKGEQMLQIGNAVVPNVSYAIAQKILDILNV